VKRYSPDIENQTFDVIVIGAGINGAGIARDAAMRGLKVLLIDKGDLASGTTSWSTRLIHGGLRYLEHGEIGLVRESLRERERLLQLAPHLVKPLPMAREVDHQSGHDRL
jgi:glycerol-3-phosphate dehydrogenase